jgi:hypothetical protein
MADSVEFPFIAARLSRDDIRIKADAFLDEHHGKGKYMLDNTTIY